MTILLKEDLLEQDNDKLKQIIKWQEQQFLLITQDLHERIDELKLDIYYLRADLEKLKGKVKE